MAPSSSAPLRSVRWTISDSWHWWTSLLPLDLWLRPDVMCYYSAGCVSNHNKEHLIPLVCRGGWFTKIEVNIIFERCEDSPSDCWAQNLSQSRVQLSLTNVVCVDVLSLQTQCGVSARKPIRHLKDRITVSPSCVICLIVWSRSWN